MYSQHSEDGDVVDDSHSDSDSLHPGAGRACPVHTPVCTVSTVRMVMWRIVIVTVIHCIQVQAELI